MKTFPWNNRETNNYKHRGFLSTPNQQGNKIGEERKLPTTVLQLYYNYKHRGFLLHFSFGWMVFGEAVFCFDGGYELGSFGQTSSTETTTTVLHKRVAFVSLRNKKQFLILL